MPLKYDSYAKYYRKGWTSCALYCHTLFIENTKPSSHKNNHGASTQLGKRLQIYIILNIDNHVASTFFSFDFNDDNTLSKVSCE